MQHHQNVEYHLLEIAEIVLFTSHKLNRTGSVCLLLSWFLLKMEY